MSTGRWGLWLRSSSVAPVFDVDARLPFAHFDSHKHSCSERRSRHRAAQDRTGHTYKLRTAQNVEMLAALAGGAAKRNAAMSALYKDWHSNPAPEVVDKALGSTQKAYDDSLRSLRKKHSQALARLERDQVAARLPRPSGGSGPS